MIVLMLLAALPGSAIAAPEGPVRAAEGLLDGTDLEVLSEAEEAGRTHVTLLIAAEEDRTAAVVAGVRNLGGSIDFRQNRVGYVRVRVPIGKAKRTARLAAVEAIDVERRIALDDPSPQSSTPGLPQEPPTADTPRANPYMPLQDTGADAFGETPERDGRGVTVAILDTGIDLAHEALQTTSTNDPKVIDWINAIPPNNGDATWVSTTGRHNGNFTAAGINWTAPAAGGQFAFGTLVENRGDLAGGEVRGDLNRNGVIGETIGVLQNRGDNRVIVDANMNRDFTDDPVMSDYRIDRQRGFLGTDNPATPIEERMAYTVDTRRSQYDPGVDAGTWVNIGISGNSHGSHVAGITAGRGLFGGSMEGNAPGAQLISIKVCPTDGGCTTTAMTEGMLYAAQNGADLANMSVGGMRVLNDGGDAQSEIYNRIVDDYGMAIFTSAGNDGPGVNTVGHPAVAPKAIGVAASVSRETWLSNYGQPIDTEHALFTFSSRGPALDGAFKPEITAPGAAVSSVPPWQPGLPIDGIYPLPPGYAMQNGTSMSSPQAAGVGALLVSAYLDEFGSRPTPEMLKRALVSSANHIAASPAYGQGGGLIDVPAAWDVLRSTGTVAVSAIDVEVPVNTVLSPDLVKPGIGQGIYDREGIEPGDRYSRTLTLTRTSGPAGTRTFNVTQRGEMTVSMPATVNLPLNVPVNFTVQLEPGETGVHSTSIRFDDPGSNGIDHIVPATAVVAAPPAPDITYSGTVRKGGDHSVAFRVPPGTSALRMALDGGGPQVEDGQMRFRFMDPHGMPYEGLTSRECFIPDTGAGCPVGAPDVRTVVQPMAGVWEIVIEGHRASSVQQVPYSITGSLLDVDISPDPDLVGYRGPGTFGRTYEMSNNGGSFEGRLVGGTLAGIQRERLTISEGQQVQKPISVKAGTEEIHFSVGNPGVAGADLDLQLLDCRATPCTLVMRSESSGSDETVSLKNPGTGTYMALVLAYEIPGGGSTGYDFKATYRHPDLGNVVVDDAHAVRESGSKWTSEAIFTMGQQPDPGWELGGDLRVLDTAGNVIRRNTLEFELDPDAPVVTITNAPPATGSDRTVTVEFTVDDPGAATSCRLDGSDWEPCTSPHTLSDLADGDDGDHRFEVRARDVAGWGDPAAAEFVVTADSALNANLAEARWEGNDARVNPVATLTRDRDGVPVAGREVTFTWAGDELCRAVTDSAGRATCEVLLPSPDESKNRFAVSFAGDDRYGPSETDAPLVFPVRPVPPPPPVCPAIKLGLNMRGFDAAPPYGKARRVTGIRVRMKAGRDVVAKVTPKVRYRLRGKVRTVTLERRTVRINGSRQFRFLTPKKMKRDYRRAKVRLKGSKVAFMLTAQARLHGTESACDQKVKVKNLRTRVVGVSSRVGLRQLSW
ncbi:MAG: S8 family serine peptidase [Actinomycetota bacterium]|nr:S8 family serine peptidase [Actinomycetota bacterium]